MMRDKIGRARRVRRLAPMLTLAALVAGAACSPATPAPSAAPTTAPAAAPKVAPTTAPAAAPTVAPTTAPAAAAPTVAPTSAPAAAAATPGGSAAAGSPAGCTNTPFKLGLDASLNSTDFWTNYISFAQDFAKQCNAQLIGPLIHNNDPALEFTNIKTMVDQGAQAVIVNPADSAAIAPALDYAASKNVPVISDDVAPSSGKVFMIVRADNVVYGQQSCQYIAQHAGGTGTIAILEGNLASLNGKDRTDGCKQILSSKFSDFKVAEYATKWDTPTAVNDAKTAIGTYPDLVGIYIEWSAPEDGVIAALTSANKLQPVGAQGHVAVVGNDGTPHEHDLIRQGMLDATISQPANLYAQYSVIYAQQALAGVKYSAGQKTDHNSTIIDLLGNLEDALPAPLVDKTNVDDPTLWANAKH